MKKLLILACGILFAYGCATAPVVTSPATTKPAVAAPATAKVTLKPIPLPTDINIVPPDGNLPKTLTAFSGKRKGAWGEGANLEVILIVEEISEKNAKLIYAWGETPGMTPSTGYQRYTGKVVGPRGSKPRIEFNSVTGSTFIFEMNKDGTVTGYLIGRGFKNQVTLRKE